MSQKIINKFLCETVLEWCKLRGGIPSGCVNKLEQICQQGSHSTGQAKPSKGRQPVWGSGCSTHGSKAQRTVCGAGCGRVEAWCQRLSRASPPAAPLVHVRWCCLTPSSAAAGRMCWPPRCPCEGERHLNTILYHKGNGGHGRSGLAALYHVCV